MTRTRTGVGRTARLVLAAVWLLGMCGSVRAETDRVVVASWNVENLFDTEDDPANKGDDGYTPRGWCRWTEARYALKLQHLADVLYAMRPDVVCLTEVRGDRRVLEDLSACLKDRHGYPLPAIMHREGGDMRGIDVAMMARVAPVGTNWFRAIPNQRDVLACDFVFYGRKLTVLVNHWKSQLGKKAESDAIRSEEARSVRAFLDRRLADDPAAAILVAGDFNDTVTSPILTRDAGFATDLKCVREDATGRLLYNLSGGLSEEARGTYYYSPSKLWDAFDSMSVTRGYDRRLGTRSGRGVCGRARIRRFQTAGASASSPARALPFRRVRLSRRRSEMCI